MQRILANHLPRQRKHRLVIDELADEVLVYDLNRHRAHCLNQTAALVWRECDGKSTAAEIAQRLERKLAASWDEDLVWLALRQLHQIHLLEKSITIPPRVLGMSRRQMIRNLGLAAAVAVPVVTSIVAPTAAEASTCVASGQPCSTSIMCCSVLGCSGIPGSGGTCN
jgi:hypothetical protein